MRFALLRLRLMLLPLGLALVAGGCADTSTNDLRSVGSPIALTNPLPDTTVAAKTPPKAAATEAVTETPKEPDATPAEPDTAAVPTDTPPPAETPVATAPTGAAPGPATPPGTAAKTAYPNLNQPLDEPAGKVLTPAERAKAIAEIQAQAAAAAAAKAVAPAPTPAKTGKTAKAGAKCKKNDDGTLPEGCKPID